MYGCVLYYYIIVTNHNPCHRRTFVSYIIFIISGINTVSSNARDEFVLKLNKHKIL